MTELTSSRIALSLATFWLLRLISKRISMYYKLSAIPTIGASGFFSSYLGGFNSIHHTREMISEGYRKYPGRAFKIPSLQTWIVCICGPDMVRELRQATEEQMSSKEAFEEFMHANKIIGEEISHHLDHVEVVRTSLTRNIRVLFTEIHDEVIASFADNIPSTDSWTTMHIPEPIRQIVTRTSGRLFVGSPVCRDPDYVKLNINFTISFFTTGFFLNLIPPPLMRVAVKLFSRVPEQMKLGMKLMRPIVEERLAREEKEGRDWDGKPNDVISWLLDIAQPDQRSVSHITKRILTINMAAIHTTSMVLTNAVYHMAAYPECIPILRDEMESVLGEEGWTKAAMGKLRKLDSFLKETTRMNGLGLATPIRMVLKDFTFSNGITVPAGAIINVASQAMHEDEELYPNPLTFKPFRFSEMRDMEGKHVGHELATLTNDFTLFGAGRSACPGRFVAINEIKLMLSHLLLNYDVKFKEEERYYHAPPPCLAQMSALLPDETIEVMFRTRRR